MKKKILVIAAHPDDEILGCGGSMAMHKKKLNEDVFVVILGEGITSRDKIRNTKLRKKQLKNLKERALKANRVLGVKNVKFLDIPDNRFDSLNFLDIVKSIENIVFKLKPNIVYTHSGFDLNIDHKITSDAVVTALRPQNNKFLEKIIFFEIPSSTEWESSQKKIFQPNYYNNIENYLSLKIKALKHYSPEMKKWPHPR